MPYISPQARADIVHSPPSGAGELNYVITKNIIQYWEDSKRNYQAINDIVGALEGAKAEFQRRVVVPYEDQKITENGDLYL